MDSPRPCIENMCMAVTVPVYIREAGDTSKAKLTLGSVAVIIKDVNLFRR